MPDPRIPALTLWDVVRLKNILCTGDSLVSMMVLMNDGTNEITFLMKSGYDDKLDILLVSRPTIDDTKICENVKIFWT